MEIFNIIGSKHIPIDVETMNKIEQIEIDYQKAAGNIMNWYKKAESNNGIEIELQCANAESLGEKEAKKLYNKYFEMKNLLPFSIKLKRSQEKYVPGFESNPEKEPQKWVDNVNDYWECSVFIPTQEYTDCKKWLENNAFKIDVLHLKEDEWIENLNNIQKEKNNSRGVSCVRTFIDYLKMNMVDQALAVYNNESDKIRSYPDIYKMIKTKFGIKDVFDTMFRGKYKS